MKKTRQEKKEKRIRITIDLVILAIAALLTYEYVAKDFLNNQQEIVQNERMFEMTNEGDL